MAQPEGSSLSVQAGAVLKSLREERGLSQEELAEAIVCDVRSVRRWEQGKRKPQPQNLRRLAAALNKEVREMRRLIQTGTLENEEVTVHSTSTIAWPDSQGRDYPRRDPALEEALCSLFWYQAPLPNCREFYGRAREQQIVRRNIWKAVSTSIIGPRRIGKTWLLRYLYHEPGIASDRQFRMCFVDATEPGCSTQEAFLNAVLGAFTLPDQQPGTSSTSHSYPAMGLLLLENRVKQLKANNLIPLLYIDEFEGFCKHPQEFPPDFFTQLRSVAQRGLVLITASKEPLIDLVRKSGQTSPFFNIFDALYLRAFSQEEARQFFENKSAQTRFSDDDHAQLLRLAKDDQGFWPPARLQLAGQQLLLDKYYDEYHQGDQGYWQTFGERLEQTYRTTGA